MTKPAPPPPGLTPRQRWMAAQLLACGDDPELVACQCEVEFELLQETLADPVFQRTVEQYRTRQGMSWEDWNERRRRLLPIVLERVMLEGNAAALNQVLRLTRFLEDQQSPETEHRKRLAALVDGFDLRHCIEFQALGYGVSDLDSVVRAAVRIIRQRNGEPVDDLEDATDEQVAAICSRPDTTDHGNSASATILPLRRPATYNGHVHDDEDGFDDDG